MGTRVTVRKGSMDITVSLTAVDCPSCSIVYAVPDRFDTERREDGHAFFCPNGHQLSYNGEITKLRASLAKAEQDRAWYEKRAQEAIEDEARARRSLTATRGVVTKLQKRAVAGTCPFGCRRHFANVERHVATQHPGRTLDAEITEA